MEKLVKQRRVGFTLIELLVVIAIIAILLMLLMPSLERTRYKAKTLVCMSGMHQWHIAVTTYAAEHQGKLPQFNFLGGANGCTWDIGHAFWKAEADRFNEIMLYPYGITSRKLFFCPLDTTVWAREQRLDRHGGNDWTTYRSYIFWIGRRGPAYSGVRPKVDSDGDRALQDPATVLSTSNTRDLPIMSDGFLAGFGSLSQSLDNVAHDQISGGHRFRGELTDVNVLFLDGRIERRDRRQMLPRCPNPWANHLSWY